MSYHYNKASFFPTLETDFNSTNIDNGRSLFSVSQLNREVSITFNLAMFFYQGFTKRVLPPQTIWVTAHIVFPVRFVQHFYLHHFNVAHTSQHMISYANILSHNYKVTGLKSTGSPFFRYRLLFLHNISCISVSHFTRITLIHPLISALNTNSALADDDDGVRVAFLLVLRDKELSSVAKKC